VAESVRVTKAGAYAEETGAGAGEGSVLVTKAGALAELAGNAVLATKFGVYAELDNGQARVTKLGCYAELITPPVTGTLRANDALRVYYNNFDISGYIRAFSLEATVKEIAPANFTHADVKQPSLPVWLATLAGIWDKTLDDIFGAEVVGRGTSSVMYNFRVVIGIYGQGQVQCLWVANAFMNTYQTKVNVDNLFLFDAKIALSGVPVRSTN
jgi:hypothetical protein